MGNRSSFLCREAEVDWVEYSQEPWRSVRSRELDALGGLDRDVVARGDSMTVKVKYLALGCSDVADSIETALDLKKPEKKTYKHDGYMLNTELRAIERRLTTLGGDGKERAAQGDDTDDLWISDDRRVKNVKKTKNQPSPSWVELQKKELAEKQAQRQKMLDYAKAARASSKMNGARSANDPSPLKGQLLSKLEGTEITSDPTPKALAPQPAVSQWKKRIHSARRRTILIILTIIRLKKGKVAERMQRIDDFSFYIPLALGNDYARFLQEQENYSRISAQVARITKFIKDLEIQIEEMETEGDRPSLPTASLDADLAPLAALKVNLNDEENRLKKSDLLLNMYIGRANASFPDKRFLMPPHVDAPVTAGSDIQADVIKKLREGKIVFQVLASEDEMLLPTLDADGEGSSLDLYTSDPWSLAIQARPGSIPLNSDRIEGLSLGARAIIQMRAAVEAAAGPEALANLTVVLSLNETQADKAITELYNRGHFGLKWQNVFITLAPKENGYRYDKESKLWLKDGSGEVNARGLGTGFSLVKLASPSDAFTIDEEGIRRYLGGSLIDQLCLSGREWLVSRRIGDLSLLSTVHRDIGGGALDLDSLSKSMKLKHDFGATCATQGLHIKIQSGRSLVDSVLMGNASGSPSKASKSRTSILELSSSEAASVALSDVVNKQKADGSLVLGSSRYDIHLPSLATALSHIILRPKLVLRGGMNVHISVPMSDLTSHPRMKCLAFMARLEDNPFLRSPSEVQSLISLLKVQDKDAMWLKAAGLSSSLVTQLRRSIDLPTKGNSITSRKPIRILVLCSTGINSTVTEKGLDFAARMSRPDDEIVLMSVVDTAIDLPEAQKTLLAWHEYLQSTNGLGCVNIRIDVIVRGTNGLISALESYVNASQASLVVMSSQRITSGNLNSLQSHTSVTLSLAKRILGITPLVICTHNNKSRQLSDTKASTDRRGSSSIVAMVEPQAKAMVSWISSCCDPFRGDSLVLATPQANERLSSKKHKSQAKRLIESLVDIAGASHLSTKQIEVAEGQKGHVELMACAENIDATFIALSLQADSKAIPSETLMMVRSSRVPILLFR